MSDSYWFLQDGQRHRAVSLDVRADGQKQVLRITNYNPALSIYKPKSRHTSTISRQDTVSSSSEAFEAIAEEVAPGLVFKLDCAGIGISLINRKLVEVIYLSVDSLKFEYADSTVAQSVNLICGTLQIDNQLYEALYPVILQPTPITKDSDSVAASPTVQGSVIWLKDQGMVTCHVSLLSLISSSCRARSVFHQILLHSTSSLNHRSRRRSTFCGLRSHQDQRSLLGR
jgi:vacuolar protein sorting-associated protein 13A/C